MAVYPLPSREGISKSAPLRNPCAGIVHLKRKQQVTDLATCQPLACITKYLGDTRQHTQIPRPLFWHTSFLPVRFVCGRSLDAVRHLTTHRRPDAPGAIIRPRSMKQAPVHPPRGTGQRQGIGRLPRAGLGTQGRACSSAQLPLCYKITGIALLHPSTWAADVRRRELPPVPRERGLGEVMAEVSADPTSEEASTWDVLRPARVDDRSDYGRRVWSLRQPSVASATSLAVRSPIICPHNQGQHRSCCEPRHGYSVR